MSESIRQYMNVVLILTSLCTIMLPLSMLPALIYLRHIQNFQLDERRERIIPLFFTTICFYVAHHLLHRFLNGVSIFSLFLLASTFVVLALLSISLFWKVSIHSAGVAGVTALILVISFNFSVDMTFFLSAAIICSGLVISSRLALKTHSVAQLLVGYITGFSIIYTFLSFYIH